MQQRSLSWAVLVGGAIGGALDLVFAVAFAGYYGASPARVFQAIASGLLGKTAFEGGWPVSVLGVACHFVLSWIWAALFAAVALRSRRIAHRPVIAGAVFGVGVFLCMRLIVLPLSAYPRPVTFPPLGTVLDLLSHMFLFGVPIAVMVARSLEMRRELRNSAIAR